MLRDTVRHDAELGGSVLLDSVFQDTVRHEMVLHGSGSTQHSLRGEVLLPPPTPPQP